MVNFAECLQQSLWIKHKPSFYLTKCFIYLEQSLRGILQENVLKILTKYLKKTYKGVHVQQCCKPDAHNCTKKQTGIFQAFN